MDAWISLSDGALPHHRWDDTAVVFNRITGETHQLGLLAAELIDSLISTPRQTVSGIHADFAGLIDEVEPGESVQMIEGVLSQLELLGLVKRTPA